MKKLEICSMENVQGGGRLGCFAAMGAFGVALGGLHRAVGASQYADAVADVANASATMVAACEDQL